jgi:hypothetical protein
MKIIFSTLFLCFSVAAMAQMNRGGYTANDLKDLPGNWTGTMVYTINGADKSEVTYKTNLEIVDMKDSFMLKFIHTGTDGKQLNENYAFRIYEDGNKMRFDSSEYDIMAIRRRGVRLSIIAEREGVDKNLPANFQQTITIGPGILNIEKKIRYMDMVDYFIRSRSAFTKNK